MDDGQMMVRRRSDEGQMMDGCWSDDGQMRVRRWLDDVEGHMGVMFYPQILGIWIFNFAPQMPG